MNFIDIVALVAIGWGAFRGFRNGVIIEVAGLLGLIVGIWAGLKLAFVFANYYRDNFEIPANYIPLLAFLSAFLIGIGGVWLLGRILNKMINSVALGIPNRLAGLTFGAAKWAFLIGTLLSLVGNSQMIPEETQTESIAYSPLNQYCKTVQSYTIGLIPAVSNVFNDVEGYFVELDSARGGESLPPVSSQEEEEEPSTGLSRP